MGFKRGMSRLYGILCLQLHFVAVDELDFLKISDGSIENLPISKVVSPALISDLPATNYFHLTTIRVDNR